MKMYGYEVVVPRKVLIEKGDKIPDIPEPKVRNLGKGWYEQALETKKNKCQKGKVR